jgi:hypothetical protein
MEEKYQNGKELNAETEFAMFKFGSRGEMACSNKSSSETYNRNGDLSLMETQDAFQTPIIFHFLQIPKYCGM